MHTVRWAPTGLQNGCVQKCRASTAAAEPEAGEAAVPVALLRAASEPGLETPMFGQELQSLFRGCGGCAKGWKGS